MSLARFSGDHCSRLACLHIHQNKGGAMRYHAHSSVILSTLAALVTLAGCDRNRPDDYQVESASGTVALDEATWIRDSLRSDALIMGALRATHLMEIEASQVARIRASHVDVRTFATQMIDDHQGLIKRADSLAKVLDIKLLDPPDAIEEIHDRKIDSLRKLTADTSRIASPFDRAFMDQQVRAHRQVLDLIDTAIERAQRSELKTALEKEVRPAVMRHLQHAETLQLKVAA
jgi:putative membrane protein